MLPDAPPVTLDELRRERDALLARAFELEEADRLAEAAALWPELERLTTQIDAVRARRSDTDGEEAA
jgi:hypothetical protein